MKRKGSLSIVYLVNYVTSTFDLTHDLDHGLWVGVGGFSKVVATSIHVGEYFKLFTPLEMFGWTHLFEFGIMCCMLHTFHVSSRIMANISESSILLSQ